MKTVKELLQSYYSNIQKPDATVSLFAIDGVFELPYLIVEQVLRYIRKILFYMKSTLLE